MLFGVCDTTASAEVKWLSGFSLAATFDGEFSSVTRSYAGKGGMRGDVGSVAAIIIHAAPHVRPQGHAPVPSELAGCGKGAVRARLSGVGRARSRRKNQGIAQGIARLSRCEQRVEESCRV